MPTEAVYKAVPFQEAIDSFRSKVRLPSRHYTDVMEKMHARGFMVAGAMQDDLLSGFQEAINKALAQGATLAEFRADFARLIKTHGWSYRGSPGWRSRVIFETNVRTSYMSGKWEQMQRVKDERPYARYVAMQDRRTRPEHAAWHGMVVPLDDPWWDTHWPPNGWGCRCSAQNVSERDVEREGRQVTSPPPDTPYTVYLKGPDGPVPVETVPGIDPGWAYNPGKAAYGIRYTDADKAAMEADGSWKNRKVLTPGTYKDYGLPEELPVRAAGTKLAAVADGPGDAQRIMQNILGGPEKIITGPDGMGVLVSAAVLAGHHPERSPFYPFLQELIEDPEEIWMSLDEHIVTGRVELRKRYVKLLRVGEKSQAMYLVGQVVKGQFVAWTMVTSSNPSGLNRQRVGKLLYFKEK
ncbi:MAG: minor capsid protein [Desulfovibrio sp.]|jgi:SPP1 gp7 family putative phage head morphogenesis protein|nr:minor capsid protein [Desulfovibrio sp.]